MTNMLKNALILILAFSFIYFYKKSNDLTQANNQLTLELRDLQGGYEALAVQFQNENFTNDY
jgi:hypothetical protein